ncbi:hypothetical protein ACGFNP_34085 [Nonomuraea sp. NPDC049269]|uniref:hypothetical protein n=1 Tax=Nonomuraea sp. NPDC049269 TaxID=3364349 RepID=UPI003719FF8A
MYAASPISDFAGHEACGSGSWINPIMINPNGEGDFHAGDDPATCIPYPTNPSNPLCLSRESFHPNDTGTSAYAGVLARTLSQIGYQGG